MGASMLCEPELLESYTKDISALVEAFSEKDPAGKQSLVQLLTSDAQAFCAASIKVLANVKDSAGARFLMYLLTKEKLLTAGLLDAGVCSLKDAISATRSIDEMGSRLQPALEMALSRALQGRATPESSTQVMRILELLGVIATQNCWPSFQSELMAHPDGAVRSKAALLIGRGLKNRAWISRRLMDKDARVQANAVEALWGMDAEEARPVLTTALLSRYHRVAANAALGLYRFSDLKAVRALMEMAGRTDPPSQVSGLWAMAETEDPRFIPFLTEKFKTSQGKVKLAVTRALSRIRRHEKACAAKGPVHIQISAAKVSGSGGRHLEIALSRPGGDEITALKPTEFALWEGGILIEDYEIKLPNNPAVLVVGIVAPRFTSMIDSYGNAIGECLKRCLALKRPDDWWRIDRYAIEAVAADPNAPVEKSTVPYDDSLITQELKTRQYFIAETSHLEKAITLPVPRDRAAADAIDAIERQCAAMDKNSGKRHLFLFIHPAAMSTLDEPEHIKRLKELVGKEGVTLHGVCPGSDEKCANLRDLCRSGPDGTFHVSSVAKLADEFEQTYRHLLNRYQIDYSLRAKAEPAPLTLQICSDYGVGRTEFLFA